MLSPLFRSTVPDAFDNMTATDDLAQECRIGQKDKKGNAFSGVTAVTDFCAHSHRDNNNMDGGLTMVIIICLTNTIKKQLAISVFITLHLVFP